MWLFLRALAFLALPALSIARNVTVSGQSAGASQAIQHLVAFSASVEGAAILAGSPYGCGNLPKAKRDECYGYNPYGYGDDYGYGGVGQHCCDINNCDYDLTGDMLRMFYGTMKNRVLANSTLHWVPQHPYIPRPANATEQEVEDHLRRTGVARWAVVYVPQSCKGRVDRCRIHVNYHGCIKSRWQERLHWLRSLDLNEYAEANDIIVVYPQDKGDKQSGKGCWSWTPVEDPKFDTKQSLQLRMVNSIVGNLTEALAAARVSNHFPMIHWSGMVEDF